MIAKAWRLAVRFHVVLFLTALIFFAAIPFATRVDGIIIPLREPEPCPPELLLMSQLEIRYHHGDVTIDNQVATTYIDQGFYNSND